MTSRAHGSRVLPDFQTIATKKEVEPQTKSKKAHILPLSYRRILH